MAIRSPKPNNRLSTAVVGGESALNARTKRKARRLLAVGCLGLAMSGLTGCTMLGGAYSSITDSECCDEFLIGYRNRAMAEKAWYCRKDQFCDHQYAADFKAGFIDGYIEVANGGPGCCPTVAPSKYWGWRYQSAYGQKAVEAWFAGYPLGIQAAEEDGIGHYQQIYMTGGGVPAGAPLAPAIHGAPPVSNPFYSEPPQEFVPVPGAIDKGMEEIGPGVEVPMEVEIKEPETVFNNPRNGESPIAVAAPVTTEDDAELVSQFQIADAPAAEVAVTPPGQPEGTAVDSEVVIEDIFGTSAPISTESESDELPFSFE